MNTTNTIYHAEVDTTSSPYLCRTMATRRGVSKRPASSEGILISWLHVIIAWTHGIPLCDHSLTEVEYWTHAAASLSKLAALHSSADTVETINRVNRLLLAWPTDDTVPAEGLDSVKGVCKKLTSGLNEIKSTADRDAKYVCIEGRRKMCLCLIHLR